MDETHSTALEGELTLTRIFDVPPETLFRMWTDPKHLARWWGPKEFTNPICELDPRCGGALYIVMRAPDGVEYPMKGIFREFQPPTHLVFTNIATDKDGNTLLDGLTTITFADHGGKTKLTMHTHVKGMVPDASAMLAGMETGWNQSLDRLSDLIGKTT